MSQVNHPRRYPQLLLFSGTRAILNTGYRMIYPFLPVVARAVQVNLESMALVASARALLGLFGPLFGFGADRYGRVAAMRAGLGLFLAGLLLVAFMPGYPTVFAAFMLGAAGKIVFDSAMQAYLGDHIHYKQRGRAIAITELGWSGASLIGLPVAGWLIARGGWLSPFQALAIAALLTMLLLPRMLPSDRSQHSRNLVLRGALQTMTSSSAAIAGLVVTLLISASNETVNIIYGVWMEAAFGLQVAALGAASAVIGVAELGGEGLVAGFTDHIGKRRAIGGGIFTMACAAMLLPSLGKTLVGSLLGLFVFFITFEFSYVSALSLMTALSPDARATLMAGNIAAAAAGRAIGAIIGPVLYANGIMANSIAGAGLAVLSLLVLMLFMRVE